MNKKGFTLVELLAVIVVLLLVALVAFPSLINSIKNSNEDSYNSIVNDILLSAEAFNSNYHGSVYQVPLSTLKEMNYVSGNPINPKNNQKMDGCVYIYEDKYIYKEETCDLIYDFTDEKSKEIIHES